MLETALSILIPALLLAYYLHKLRSSDQGSWWMVGLLVGGTCCYYIGMLIARTSPGPGTTLQLAGACLFFTGVAIQTPRRNSAQPPVPNAGEEKPSPPAGE